MSRIIKRLNEEEFNFMLNYFVQQYDLTSVYNGKLIYSASKHKEFNYPVRNKKAGYYSIYINSTDIFIFIQDPSFHAHYFLCLEVIPDFIPELSEYFIKELKTVQIEGKEYRKPNISIFTDFEIKHTDYNSTLSGINIFERHDNRPVRILSLYNLYPLVYKYSNNVLMAENFEVYDEHIIKSYKLDTLCYKLPKIDINDPITILFNAFIGDLIKADIIHKDVSVNSNTCIREVSIIDGIYYVFGNYVKEI